MTQPKTRWALLPLLLLSGVLLSGVFVDSLVQADSPVEAFGQGSPSPARLAFKMSATKADIVTAEQRIQSALNAQAIASPARLVVVYFTPKDREPASNHLERIRLITEEACTFYQRELARHGFPDRQLRVMRNQTGQVEVIDVVGADKDQDYGKPDGARIRKEVIPVLRQRGIQADQVTILLFCNLMNYDPVQSTISHHSPYYGGGTHLTGTAWQCDSPILDPRRFRDKTPLLDGEYGRITIGKHNSIFIGGVIHELGHALSLPHCRERLDERSAFGTALMGSGNRTYGEQLRGESKGTFLTQAHALRLAALPIFNEKVPATVFERRDVQWSQLTIDTAERKYITVAGQVSSSSPVHSVVAYFDPQGRDDYDAATAAAVVDQAGHFALRSEPLPKGRSGQLRLVACHVDGETTERSFEYAVTASGEPRVEKIQIQLGLAPIATAIEKGDLPAAAKLADQLSSENQPLKQAAQELVNRFETTMAASQQSLAEVPAATPTIRLSQLKPKEAKVGWLRPTFNRVPQKPSLICIDGEYFASGIYAHAPAKHVYDLNQQWKRFQGGCGVQAGFGGEVDFEIWGDGEKLWSATDVTNGPQQRFDIDVQQVNELSLIVTDSQNGGSGDWGIWIEPTLKR